MLIWLTTHPIVFCWDNLSIICFYAALKTSWTEVWMCPFVTLLTLLAFLPCLRALEWFLLAASGYSPCRRHLSHGLTTAFLMTDMLASFCILPQLCMHTRK